MNRVLAAFAVLMATAAAPAPAPTPVVTTFINYKMPEHGYRVRQDTDFGTNKFTITALVDAYGNRDVDVTFLNANGTSHGEYVVMNGLVYVKNGNAWAPAAAPRWLAVVLLSGNYPPAAGFQAPGRVVTEQGTAPCETGTCRLYLASGVTKLNEQPMATVWHLAVDPQTTYLASFESQIVKPDGTQFMKLDEKFDRFDGVHLTVPDVTSPAATSQCDKANASIGAIEVCVVKGMFTDDVYTLRVGGTLALRSSEPLAEDGVASPVIDGLTLRCTPKKVAQPVDPALAATLRNSGMTDAQIQSSLGEREISADCTVSSRNQPLATLHFDFK